VSPTGPPATDEALKSCCAAIYDHDWTRLLLGSTLHPGGTDLTRTLLKSVGVGPDDVVLDVASGTGTTALILAEEFGATVSGIDLGPGSVQEAQTNAAARNLPVSFTLGDAESLPSADGAFDVVVCECAFCLFPNKATAASEFARVLRPGGRLALSDVVLDQERADPRLRSVAGWVACLADARSAEAYATLLSEAGFEMGRIEHHDAALLDLLAQIDARLRIAKMTGLAGDLDLEKAFKLVDLATVAVAEQVAGYVTITATMPEE